MRNSREWIDRILNTLFAPDERRIQSWIDKIEEKHRNYIEERRPNGFIYAGNFYRSSKASVLNLRRHALHIDLWSEFDACLKDKNTINNDKQLIKQALFLLLEPCDTIQDVRDALPECLIDILFELKALPRIRKFAFTIQGKEGQLKFVNQMLPTMEEYTAARMLF